MSPRKKRGRDGEPPAHPLARAIEQLYAAGATPRLVIDSRRADVSVPDFVRSKWAERLVIDLDASYPLDLVYDDAGVHATMAFSGVVTRCTFSWASIYRVLNRVDGHGISVPAHEPLAELPPELAYEARELRAVTEIVDAKKDEPKATVVKSDEPKKEAIKPALAAVPTPPKEPSEAQSASDAEAKARRAKFRVIEGG